MIRTHQVRIYQCKLCPALILGDSDTSMAKIMTIGMKRHHGNEVGHCKEHVQHHEIERCPNLHVAIVVALDQPIKPAARANHGAIHDVVCAQVGFIAVIACRHYGRPL